MEKHELVPHRDGSLPLLRLATLFGLGLEPRSRTHAFVVGAGQDAIALGVDRIVGQREIVVRAMSDALLKVDGISGATELGDGRVVLIVDALALSRRVRAERLSRSRVRPPAGVTATAAAAGGIA
jgi:two-component system chemotaxis sensor kinase CheA